MLLPSRDEFLRLAENNRPIPVYRDFLADIETPLSAYWKLSHDETYSFLLESVTGGEQLARYSILGARPRTILRTKGSSVRKISRAGDQRFELEGGKDPLDLLKEEMGIGISEIGPNMPSFVGGAVGLLSYDLVRFFEKLPDSCEDDLDLDDLAMMITDSVIVFDHAKNVMRIVVLADPTPTGYEEAQAEIERVARRLRAPIPDIPGVKGPGIEVSANRSSDDYCDAVRKAIEYVGAGDGFQFVLSQRFSCPSAAHPVMLYRALRPLNPSPYMFLMRFGNFDLVGASPELLVSLSGREARVRPIAGTRPRGANEAEDERLAEELLADEKELAEHIMLVDLGRNDLGRVSKYGTVKVNEYMVIERYSHVMHIVSDVTGELDDGKDAFDLIRATFPAGTVSGAPKVRAMEIIDELEPTRRGAYAGAIGFFSSNGDLETAIAIRTITLKEGIAYVQAGAGIVWDSVPEREDQECRNKAQAALKAIENANTGNLPIL